MKRKLIMIMLLLPIAWLILSCSNDDDEKSVRHQLVGVWSTTMPYSEWRVIELCSDGTLHYDLSFNSNGEYSYNSHDSSHWSYNESDQTISMYSDYNSDFAFTYKVNMTEDGNSWAGYGYKSGKPKTYSFTRVKDAKKAH